MSELKKIYIKDLANELVENLQKVSKKHKSINCYAIFVEGDHFCAIYPEYESEKEQERVTRKFMDYFLQNKQACDKFAEIVVPPARFFEREVKKAIREARRNRY